MSETIHGIHKSQRLWENLARVIKRLVLSDCVRKYKEHIMVR